MTTWTKRPTTTTHYSDTTVSSNGYSDVSVSSNNWNEVNPTSGQTIQGTPIGLLLSLTVEVLADVVSAIQTDWNNVTNRNTYWT